MPRTKGRNSGGRAPETELAPDDFQAPEDAGIAEATAVAAYLADMTAQLEAMAVAAKLDLLAYLLSMARSEAEGIVAKGANGAGKARN
jgi:hypothetical protein